MTSPVLLLDIDNTLYDWPAFFAPSFRAMLHVISRNLGIPEETLYSECKDVFSRMRSLEYAFLIQELPSVRDLDTDRVRRLIELGRGAFKRVQKVRLQPYPGVSETLQWFDQQQVPVVGVTNSPMYRAQQRLSELHLDTLFSGLVAWEGFEGNAADPRTEGFVTRGRERQRSRIQRRVLVPEADCKPNPRHYAIALESFSSDPKVAWAVGDSLAKDLAPAADLGIHTVWARYGSGYDPDDKNMATLLRITHWNDQRIETTYTSTDFRPEHTIDRFSQLRDIVPVELVTLF